MNLSLFMRYIFNPFIFAMLLGFVLTIGLFIEGKVSGNDEKDKMDYLKIFGVTTVSALVSHFVLKYKSGGIQFGGGGGWGSGYVPTIKHRVEQVSAPVQRVSYSSNDVYDENPRF